MKGIELPINILVIVAVAVIVLLGLVALYFSGFMGPAGVMNAQATKQKYCASIMNNPMGCQGGVYTSSIQINDFDADKDGVLGTSDGGTSWHETDAVWDSQLPVDVCTADDNVQDNLASLLACYFGATSERNALQICGCTI
ncbi:MAG: hypothetical protein V1818_03805 [Candidatus Aenigmatarchaeota archaeon]